jgi:hypothetical protein
VKLLVALPEAEREKYGITEPLIPLDFDALLKLPFDEVVALEDAMEGGPSLALLRLEHLHEYTAKALRAVAWLAVWQNGDGKAPVWAEFKPSPAETFYVLDNRGADAVPPAQASGDSSGKERARTSSRSAPTSRRSTTSRRTT